MSQENVETVLRAYEGVNARLEAPRDLYDPDVAASTVPLVCEMLAADTLPAASAADPGERGD